MALNTAKTAAASVEEIIEASKKDSSIENPKKRFVKTAKIEAVMNTPIVESPNPAQKTGFMSESFTLKPPENKI